jgi:hypothetical protein
MKYIIVNYEDGDEEETTRDGAIEFIKKNYNNPEDILKDFEIADGGLIRGMFRTLRIEK